MKCKYCPAPTANARAKTCDAQECRLKRRRELERVRKAKWETRKQIRGGRGGEMESFVAEIPFFAYREGGPAEFLQRWEALTAIRVDGRRKHPILDF